MEALQWAFGVRKIVQKCAYVQKISLPQNLKYDFFPFTNHYTIAAESRLKNVVVTSFWLFEAMLLHKLHFFFSIQPNV